MGKNGRESLGWLVGFSIYQKWLLFYNTFLPLLVIFFAVANFDSYGLLRWGQIGRVKVCVVSGLSGQTWLFFIYNNLPSLSSFSPPILKKSIHRHFFCDIYCGRASEASDHVIVYENSFGIYSRLRVRHCVRKCRGFFGILRHNTVCVTEYWEKDFCVEFSENYWKFSEIMGVCSDRILSIRSLQTPIISLNFQ